MVSLDFNKSVSVLSWSFSEYPTLVISNPIESSGFSATLSGTVVVLFYFCPPLPDASSVESVFVYFFLSEKEKPWLLLMFGESIKELGRLSK